jgi:RNA polymerase primary sigma factor
MRDLIAEPSVQGLLDTALETDLSDHVRSCIQALRPQEAYIVRARFGLDTGWGQTLEEIGRALQLSRERVRQIEARALEKLRHQLRHRQRHSPLGN